MAELKTKRNDASVEAFLGAVDNEVRRADARAVVALMEEVTGERAALWGASIVGFGSYRCRYPSGREFDWFLVGFSPRKASLTLYLTAGFSRYGELLGRLGKHRTGKSCLYINRLSDVDLKVLRTLVTASVAHVRASAAGP